MAITEAEITVSEHGQTLGTYRVGFGQYVVGRDDFCGVQVESNEVSRMHALLTFAAGELFIEDLGSSNGTLVNGVIVDRRTAILAGQKVQLGAALMEIRLLDESEAPPSAPAASTEPSLKSPQEQMPTLGDSSGHMPAPKNFAATAPTLPVMVAPPAPNQDILRAKKYAIGRKIAEGGMGSIIQVEDTNIRRTVAMKVMLPDMQGSREDSLRFVEEAQVMGQLEHPCIVPIYDLGLDDQGRYYYTMKYVQGKTLDDVIENIKKGDPFAIAQYPLAGLLAVYGKVLDAVGFAHSRGVVHRDLKPENIMVGDYGEVLVMDWGLAKVITLEDKSKPGRMRQDGGRKPAAVASSRVDEGDSFRTMKGVVMGTPHFMAPEQAEGRVDDIDVRTDTYALGGILYNLLTLNPPITGRSLNEVLGKVVRGGITPATSYNTMAKKTVKKGFSVILDPENNTVQELPHLPDGQVPEALSAIAQKALNTLPEERYQTVKEIQKEIEAYSTGFSTEAEGTNRVKELKMLFKRNKKPFVIGGVILSVLLVAILALIVLLFWNQRKTSGAKKKAEAQLQELKGIAPALYKDAVDNINDNAFTGAMSAVDHALLLAPENADYHYLRGNILEDLAEPASLADAISSYTKALELNPEHKLAKQNLELCKQILVQDTSKTALAPRSKQLLQEGMRQQGRTSEAQALYKRLGISPKEMLKEGQGILDAAGIKGSLFLLEEKLNLDLSNTPTENLNALKAIALDYINLENTPVRDLTPLRGMPLRRLNLKGTQVSDVSPLEECRFLEILTLPPIEKCKEVSSLRNLSRLQWISYRNDAKGTPDKRAVDFWAEGGKK